MSPDELLSTMILYERFAITFAGFTAALATVLVWRALLERSPYQRRLQNIRARGAALRIATLAPNRNRRREAGLDRARRLVRALRLLRTEQAAKAALHLAQAGYRGRDAVVLWFLAKLCLPFVFGSVALILLFGGVSPINGAGAKITVALIAVMAGAYAPDLWLKNTITKRRQSMQKGVPDTLDLLVICTEAGQSLDGAIKRVSEEIVRSSPELAEEFGLTEVELGLLPDRKTALENLDQRCGLPAIRSVVQTLAQTEKYGTPLAQSLRVLAAEYRNDRMMKAEEKAARLPAILTVPMIVFILPPLFIVLIGPAIIGLIDLFRGL